MKRQAPLTRKKPLKRTPLRKCSQKQRQRLSEYGKARATYMHGKTRCEACGSVSSLQLHHKHGRGINIARIETFMAVCDHCHRWIHAHGNEARAKGWLK